jgi:hypothetical protein
MPNPLLDSIADQLKDPIVALAAAFVIASRYPEILTFVARVIRAPAAEPRAKHTASIAVCPRATRLTSG